MDQPHSRFTRLLAIIVGAVFALPLVLAPTPPAVAATPSSATISPSSATVTWDGFLAPAAATDGEGDCLEGLTCDTFTLTVSGTPSEWSGKLIPIKITWTNPANDFDLFIHKDSNDGPAISHSAGGAPSTTEETAIDPEATGTGIYTIHVVYFAVAADQYKGTASVGAQPQLRSANYIKGGITFSPSVTARAPVSTTAGEPSNRTDKFGNHYVAGIRGVPAGTDMWYFDLQPGSPSYDPYMRRPVYRGQPDEFIVDESNAVSVGADGGGDIDLAVGFGNTNPPFLAASSLVAANISVMRSLDRGDTVQLNPAGNSVPVDDRQWNEAYGANSAYLYYRTISIPVLHFVQRSDDSGLTYGPPVFVGTDGQTGYIDVDQNDGTVYLSRQTTKQVTVAVGSPPAPGAAPTSYTDQVAATHPVAVDNIFAPVKVADDGTVYVAFSTGSYIFLAHSKDKGQTWSLPVRVSDGPETRTSLMPWIETGSKPGSVAVVWYGTSEMTNNDSANWHVFYAQSFNATADKPTFRQVKASDHIIHASNISTGGLLGAANRNLLDYFQVSIDPTGAAVIGYTDDHNDYDGNVFVTRQISGPSFNGGSVPNPGVAPAPAVPDPSGAQVMDFPNDHTIGLLVQTPVNSPFDILSVKYSCEDTASGRQLVAEMKVSDLPLAKPTVNWRVNFAANAPNSVKSPTGEYTFGVADRGDQYFLRASTDTNPNGVFTYGTVVRNPNGSLSYTTRGSAAGSFDSNTRTITMKVPLSELNKWVTKGPAISAGSTLVGLRGQTFNSFVVASVNAISDLTRGGTQYTIPTSCMAGTPPPPPPPPPPLGSIHKASGNGGLDGKSVGFRFEVENSLAGHLNYADTEAGIDMYSTAISSFSQSGPDEVTFSGTGMAGSDPVDFVVVVRDAGGNPKNDYFSISITGARSSSRAGSLTQGNIQLHR